MKVIVSPSRGTRDQPASLSLAVPSGEMKCIPVNITNHIEITVITFNDLAFSCSF